MSRSGFPFRNQLEYCAPLDRTVNQKFSPSHDRQHVTEASSNATCSYANQIGLEPIHKRKPENNTRHVERLGPLRQIYNSDFPHLPEYSLIWELSPHSGLSCRIQSLSLPYMSTRHSISPNYNMFLHACFAADVYDESFNKTANSRFLSHRNIFPLAKSSDYLLPKWNDGTRK